MYKLCDFLKSVWLALGISLFVNVNPAPAVSTSAENKADSLFNLKFEKGAIVSLKRTADAFDTDYILEGQRLGDVIIRYRPPGENWSVLSTKQIAEKGELKTQWNADAGKYTATAGLPDLVLEVSFIVGRRQLLWEINLENRSERTVEIGEVALPLPMNHDWSWDRKVTYNQRVIRHSMVSGHHSFMFWMRANAEGPYLLMTPTEDTHLEYYDHSTENENGRSIYTAYIHSLAQKEVIRENNGSWRQPHTGTTLQPAGQDGDHWNAGFKLQWASGYDEIRRQLYQEGLFNIDIAPGMTVPTGLSAKIALKNKQAIHEVEAEYPEETSVRFLETNDEGFHIYEIIFNKLGENKLTLKYGNRKHLYLEFFVTEPIETLIRKRAQFIVNRQQIRNKDKWYDGLLSDWSMKDELLLSPDNIHDIPEGRRYMISSDDPALSRPSFLAKKNVFYPVQEEVSAVDYYIENFVWGGLQMTDEEAYPYAIYGIHDWKANRESSDAGTYGKVHIWRIYDYPHIIQMYLGMYRIARYHPHIKTELSAEEYLQRAYGTAIAFYTVPPEVIDWSPYQTGNYNELSVVDLIAELEMTGWAVKARRLRHHWETKVAYFFSGEANLFGSEYPYDTTGFESTHAFARYAMSVAGRERRRRDILPLEVKQEQVRDFMEQQVLLNVGTRGWLEKVYYLYGSDYRGGGSARYTLSYMAQMGGWSLLDYSLYFADQPHEYLRLSYASILSSWALMNTGTEESNYGYWFPGKINDGGAGGGFEPLAYARTWLGQSQGRGSWYYGCEIDLGYTGYLRAAATVLTNDPVFGLTAFGGLLEQKEDHVEVIPKDGLRRRFHMLGDAQRFHLEIRYDRFADDTPITLNRDLSRLQFTLENADETIHTAKMQLSGLPTGSYHVLFDGDELSKINSDGSNKIAVELSVASSFHNIEIIVAH